MKKTKAGMIREQEESGNPKRDIRLRSKKPPSRVKMVDATTLTPLEQVYTPLKLEYPSTSELMMIDELRQSVEASRRKCRGRPRLDISDKSLKVKLEPKPGGERSGKRRGRPAKNHNFSRRPLFCGLCDFKAENLYAIEGHLKTHPHQNVYECPHCGATFSQKGNLITHIRTHTKEKPFKCVICDFAASQKINLQVHIRIHTKEKPFKCSVCDFSTAQKCNLIAHVTRRHSNVEVVKALETYDNQWRNNDSQVKYYRCGMCMFSCRLKREMVEHVKELHSFSALEY